MRSVLCCLVVALAAAAGCSNEAGAPGSPAADEAPAALATAPARAETATSEVTKSKSADLGPAAGGEDEAIARKIIYTAEIALIVESLDKAERELSRLVQAGKGYVAQMDIRGQPGSSRTGTWKVRVPVGRFESFLDAVASLGELENRQISSQEVTEEYYDLEARIKNKKVEEARLLKHLEESTGKLKDTLEVEKEVNRVREEVERMEGRIRLLTNLSSLTTITVVLHERLHYVPPRAPSFGTTIARTFETSVQVLIDAGKAVVLFAVAIAPWLPLIALAAWLVWRLSRRAFSRAAGAGAVS
jgi:uncharacterized protein DUF4349